MGKIICQIFPMPLWNICNIILEVIPYSHGHFMKFDLTPYSCDMVHLP